MKKAGFASITRHAVQKILHHALDVSPHVAFGLIGGDLKRLEHVRIIPGAPRGSGRSQPDTAAIRRAISAWQTEGVEAVALYRSSASGAMDPETLFNGTVRHVAQSDPELADRIGRLRFLLVALDTAGRLETRLYAPSPSGMEKVPVAMLEDGVPGAA